MIQTPGELRNYMELLATENRHIRKFFYGDYDDIIGGERVKMEYPLLWMESPEVGTADEDHPTLVFSFAWLVLLNGPVDDKARNFYNSERAFKIVMGILGRMQKDDIDDIINFDIEDVELMEVRRASGNNNETGWRVEMKLNSFVSLCYNVDDWTEELPAGIVPRFTWAVDNSMISLENISDQAEDMTINWRVKLDNEAEALLPVHDDEVSFGVGAWQKAYIILELLDSESGAKVECSAAFVNVDETSGESHLGLYDPG